MRGHDERVLSRLALRSLLATALLGAACRDERPWHAADWRPAEPPRRIVAASVLATEVLLAIAPRDRLAGVHVLAADRRYSPVAADVVGLPLVGAEPEQLLAARPDLVLCDPFTRPETMALLGAAGVPVVQTTNPGSFDDVAANVRRIGVLCHVEPAAERLVGTMQRQLAELRAQGADLSAWRVLRLDGDLTTYGRPSLFDALVRAAGAVNLAAEHGAGPYRKLDVETLLAWRPDVIVVSGDVGESGAERAPSVESAAAPAVPAWLAQTPGAALLRCLQNGRVVAIPGPLLGTTSPRLAEAAVLLQRRLRAWGRP